MHNIKICAQYNVVLLDSLLVPELNIMGEEKKKHLTLLIWKKKKKHISGNDFRTSTCNKNVFVRRIADLQDEGSHFQYLL